MNANPPINVNLGKQRRQKVVQKLMAQMQQRQAVPSAAGGRLAVGGGRTRLPAPHITRDAHLPPGLIKALGIGGDSIPGGGDFQTDSGGMISRGFGGQQSNVNSPAAGIPDWTGQGAGDPSATAAGPGSWGQPPQQIDTGAVQQQIDNYGQPTYSGTAQGGWGTGGSDVVSITPPQGGLIPLGNGMFYDPVNDALRGMGGGVTPPMGRLR